jgi:hypothetical protein
MVPFNKGAHGVYHFLPLLNTILAKDESVTIPRFHDENIIRIFSQFKKPVDPPPVAVLKFI